MPQPAARSTPTTQRVDSDDDLALLERIAAGDRAAIQRLYFAYHRRLSRFLSRTVRRPDLVEEIVNDTMFTVWRGAGDFRGDSRVSTWVMGIAYRHALKRMRRDRRSSETLSIEQHDIDPGNDAGAGQRELRECIERALLSLPAPQRLVIELAYFMGYSCEEISTIADCPVNTVKTRLFHARERLRALLPGLSDTAAAPDQRYPV
jgi:RNA polymerase sigma-70 factor (ECF subfamily)